MSDETKQPLIPSLLYTQGDENVQRSEEEDLKVPDPAPDVAEAAIAQAINCGSKGDTNESSCTNAKSR